MFRHDRKLWTAALLASGVALGGATLALNGTAVPAHAQISGSVLTGTQLTRLQRLSGQFAYTSGTAATAVRQAIVTATSGLSASAARATRAQLEATLVPAKRIRFAVQSSPTATLLQVVEGERSLSTPLTGVLQNLTTVKTGARLSQQLQTSALVQVVENRGLRQERRFSLDGGGNTLTLDVRVSGTGLSTVVQTQSIYRRQ